jgi:hypothetical protein
MCDTRQSENKFTLEEKQPFYAGEARESTRREKLQVQFREQARHLRIRAGQLEDLATRLDNSPAYVEELVSEARNI